MHVNANLTFREVTAERWADFEALFRARGAPSYCWCMVWRATSAEKKGFTPAKRKEAMRRLINRKTPVGLLAYRDGHAVAWCSIGPRESFIDRMAPVPASDDGETVWSLNCFYVPRSLRHQGIMTRLIEAARAHAKDRGATVLEAYPVDADSPSYRFGGYVPVFEAAGFTEVGMAGSRRHVVRLSLGS